MGDTDKKEKKNGFSLDWLVGGVLSKIGETVDRITGRGWNPSSSLATSKLIEKIKFLLDEEVRDLGRDGKFAPHLLTLKMQWNKFSADSEDELEKLRTELHAATIDHINDKLYHTYGPVEINIKTDYFTEGVRLIGGFGRFGDEDEEAAVNVTLPNIKVEQVGDGSRVSINLGPDNVVTEARPAYFAEFEIDGRKFRKGLDFSASARYSVGRGKENEIALEHPSVSKVHAALVLNKDGRLVVADTGSTNGTYINGQRIAYGKAVEIPEGSEIRFGSIEVKLARSNPPAEGESDLETEANRPAPQSVAAETQPVAVSESISKANQLEAEAESTDGSEWDDFEKLPDIQEPDVEEDREGTQDWEI